MRGDFSSWRNEQQQNFNGVLHQQGRVLLDSDWNAQSRITNDWQDTAGQDIIGAGVVAVPADQPNAFKIMQAQITGGKIELHVGLGRVWDDGLLVNLYGANPTDTEATRTATYLEPPIQNPVPMNPAPPPTVRDAVVLEVWREEVNGFQLPDLLTEPALGGVDTTERAHTAMAFRLLRLADGETCDSITDKLKDDFPNKGKLTVKLEPDNATSGDCPVAAGGGYTGFEHNLYRIEIARVDGAGAMFKWSQFNGGLVGRGKFDSVSRKITLTANKAAIASSGLNDFYLEAVTFDDALGHWQVTFGAKVSLNSDDDLTASPTPIFGAMPTTSGDNTIFFRLWNDVRLISDFAVEQPLQDGIRLQFDPVAAGKYVPGDYWTFDVRAGEIFNPQPLIANQPPAGIYYHRAPLGVVTWNSASGAISDCRRIFQPLTRLATCCSYRVGDGKQSHGDFTSIQAALDHLPTSGGEICVLPGLYEENVTIANKHDITIKGCGARSRVKFKTNAPVIKVDQSQNIKLESFQVEAHAENVGVLLTGPERQAGAIGQPDLLREISLHHLHLFARRGSAIEAHIGHFITIRACRITMFDEATEAAAVYFVGDDSLIEENLIQVVSPRQMPGNDPPSDEISLEFEASLGHGGLHLGGGCDRVRVINNLILSGVGNGITLGSVDEEEQGGKLVRKFRPWRKPSQTPCKKRPSVPKPGATVVVDTTTREIAGPPLSEILIERNRILRMGSNGIGVDAFFDLSGADEMISVSGLTILGNQIRHCLNQAPDEIPANMVDSQGYGGIALADVDDLVVRDNRIEDNGPDQLEPICGIFVLHGEGVEIERNRIANNGARNNQPTNKAKLGRRGGINLVYAIAPHKVAVAPPNPTVDFQQQIPFSLGLPAVKIHDNVVSVPLGQALAMTALGPVSVVGNQFTSLGVVLRANSPGFLAATVMIFNLGLSNELWFQLLAFAAVKRSQISAPRAASNNNPDVAAQAGLDDARLGQYLANGNVLFSNNQCALNLLEPGLSLAVTSILIFSLDDIGFHNNQCDCDLYDDAILTQALLFGISLRVSDNRFKETLTRALLALSAITLGLLNTTTDNQSTHCLLIRGGLVVDDSNLHLLSVFSRKFCDRFEAVQSDFAGKYARG